MRRGAYPFFLAFFGGKETDDKASYRSRGYHGGRGPLVTAWQEVRRSKRRNGGGGADIKDRKPKILKEPLKNDRNPLKQPFKKG